MCSSKIDYKKMFIFEKNGFASILSKEWTNGQLSLRINQKIVYNIAVDS